MEEGEMCVRYWRCEFPTPVILAATCMPRRMLPDGTRDPGWLHLHPYSLMGTYLLKGVRPSPFPHRLTFVGPPIHAAG